jgi:hypothetical protein
VQPTTTRYVLGFDAECAFCTDVAEEIRERFGTDLELQGLTSHEMLSWRRASALGEDPAWAPVFVKISGEKVRVFTGYRLALALAWRLGIAETYRLTKALGEFERCDNAEPEGHGAAATLLTRAQFMRNLTKAAAGLAFTIGVLGTSTAGAQEGDRTVEPAGICCAAICDYCYDKWGRRCGACDKVRRCRENHSGNGCLCGNCFCRRRYC